MAKITKRGNSLGVNINPQLLNQLGWKENTQIKFILKGKKLVLEEEKMITLKITTVNGDTIEVKGNNYKFENGTHYLNGQSFPDSIVDEVIK